MAIEAILFDKDGTLFDFEASWAGWMQGVIGILSEGSAPVAAALAASLRFDMAACRFAPDSPVIAGTLAEVAPLLVPHLPALTLGEIATRLETSARAVAMMPAVPLHPLLEGLRAGGYALGVATNASGGEARAHLDAAGIATFFDFVAGCDAGFGAKPAPGMCLAFARALGLPPEAVLMVGDSLHDLEAGRAAGMRTAGVLTGLATREDLAPHADVVLADIGQLHLWLQGAGAAPSRPRAG
ncbi:MAG: phosphoglycolate phosphatase [Rhodobacteraceae bacterium HLUCCO18]|nr:MAG: phosphoglycolate phosphatase [Rhodobacteraceae bacterium HLUCCO18]